MENVLFVAGGIFTIYCASLAINWFVIQVVTSSDSGPFGIESRVFDLILDRDYLELEWRDNIVRLCHWGGFLLWMFFVYVLVRDILIKIEKSKESH